MSKAGGLVLIAGGLTVAAWVMSSGESTSWPEFSGLTDVVKTARVDERPNQEPAAPMPRPAFRPIASIAPRTSEPLPGFSTPVVVTVTPRPSDVVAAQPRLAAVPKDRDGLARELQKELRRVGCYDGELNGVWTPATRRAMKAFTDRINATLPVDEPDAVLFTMVASQRDTVCGKPCPPGQGISQDGRCLPNAILAKAAKRPPAPSTVAHLPSATPPPGGRPAPAISSAWTTTTTAARTPPPPVVAVAPTSPQPVIALAPPSASPPPEGRMGLAGPTPEATPTPAGAAQPETASPVAGVAPAAKPQAPPKRVVQSEASWSRTMNARRFDSPN
jgi:Putative peptidoglycan binding domain